MSALDRLRKLDAEATEGPWSVLGDGAQAFGPNGMVANCRTQWHDDDDEDGLEEDDARSICNARALVLLRNALPALITLLEAADKCVHGGPVIRIINRAAYDAAEAAFARALEGSDASHPQGGEKS